MSEDIAQADRMCGKNKDISEEMLEILQQMLTSTSLPESFCLPSYLEEDVKFKTLYDYCMDLRILSNALSKGDLHQFVYGKGYVLSNLKALQGNLRHLTWQTKMVAEGDFSQNVDFLGDFSDAFNEMTHRLENSTAQMQHMATYDMLTQVPNRLSLDHFLRSAFNEAKENDFPLSVLLIDIDRFKNVNDTYGHSAGDKVLVTLSEALSTQLRTSDFFSRYGGEEFVAVLPHSKLADAEKIALRFLEKAQQTTTHISENVCITVTISIGISEMCAEDTRYDQVLARCDTALYKAKNSGRNQIYTD